MEKKSVIVMTFVIIFSLVLFFVYNYFFIRNSSIKKGMVSNIYYEVGKVSDGCLSSNNLSSTSYTKKGYYVNKKESGEVVYQIMLGEKPTGGYDILVKSVTKTRKGIVITINEKNSEEVAVDTITCPNISITFKKNPGKVIIKDGKAILKKIS